MSETNTDRISSRQSSICRKVCCSPCYLLLKCFKCITNVLVVRQTEGAMISLFNNKILPFLAGVLITTPIGILAYEYGTQAASVASTTSNLLFYHITSIPEYAAPVIGHVSYAWNVTYTSMSSTTNTVSKGIQSGYNILVPFINMTIDTGSLVSMHLQQGYQSFLPIINETMSNLRKKDEVHN